MTCDGYPIYFFLSFKDFFKNRFLIQDEEEASGFEEINFNYGKMFSDEAITIHIGGGGGGTRVEDWSIDLKGLGSNISGTWAF